MKVFISSTYEDLKEYRERAIEVVNRYDCQPVAMEFFMSQPQDAETVCDKEVQECDIFIGIYAHRYGFMPKGQTKSITQQEYELAKKSGKDCLCFIVLLRPGAAGIERTSKIAGINSRRTPANNQRIRPGCVSILRSLSIRGPPFLRWHPRIRDAQARND